MAESGTLDDRIGEARSSLTNGGPARELLEFLTQSTEGRGYTGLLE